MNIREHPTLKPSHIKDYTNSRDVPLHTTDEMMHVICHVTFHLLAGGLIGFPHPTSKVGYRQPVTCGPPGLQRGAVMRWIQWQSLTIVIVVFIVIRIFQRHYFGPRHQRHPGMLTRQRRAVMGTQHPRSDAFPPLDRFF